MGFYHGLWLSGMSAVDSQAIATSE